MRMVGLAADAASLGFAELSGEVLRVIGDGRLVDASSIS